MRLEGLRPMVPTKIIDYVEIIGVIMRTKRMLRLGQEIRNHETRITQLRGILKEEGIRRHKQRRSSTRMSIIMAKKRLAACQKTLERIEAKIDAKIPAF